MCSVLRDFYAIACQRVEDIKNFVAMDTKQMNFCTLIFKSGMPHIYSLWFKLASSFLFAVPLKLQNGEDMSCPQKSKAWLKLDDKMRMNEGNT